MKNVLFLMHVQWQDVHNVTYIISTFLHIVYIFNCYVLNFKRLNVLQLCVAFNVIVIFLCTCLGASLVPILTSGGDTCHAHIHTVSRRIFQFLQFYPPDVAS